MPDVLNDIRSEIESRMKELKPLVAEYERLQTASAALEGVSPPPAATARAPRAPARKSSAAGRPRTNGRAPKANRAAANGGARRGRPKGSGARGAQALQLVKENPGITIPQIAEKMGIKQNYLYRVLPGLADDGLLTKDGRGWHPKDAA